jgi:TolB-like protein
MEPSAEEIRDQLERMLASHAFATAPRLRRFLRYVVDRTVAGEGGQLKEYTIGTDVFERDAQYDPRIDSIVRVEAGRLRAKLYDYYAGEGAADRVLVRMSRGGYVPVFETRDGAAAAPAPPAASSHTTFRFRWPVAVLLLALIAVLASGVGRPTQEPPPQPRTDLRVAVLPFTHYAPGGADEMLAARITDGVATELARLNIVGVVSRTSARQFEDARKPLREIAELLSAGEVIEGSVLTEGDIVRVRTRIVEGRADLKTAVRDFEGRRDDLDALTRRIAQALSAAFHSRAMR